MSRRGLAIVICFVLLAPGLAQDWHYDEKTEMNYNCELVNRLYDDYGDEIFMMKDADFVRSFGDFLVMLFALCLPEDDRVIVLGAPSETDADNDAIVVTDAAEEAEDAPESEADTALAAAVELDNEPWFDAELVNDKMHRLDEVNCSIMVIDRFPDDFNVTYGGFRQDDMSIDVYLPDEEEPLKMDHTHRYTLNMAGIDVPSRTEWAQGDSFPYGRYTIEVVVDDEQYRFWWLRTEESEAYRTVALTCLRAEEELVDGSRDDSQAITRLIDGETHKFEGTDCFLVTSDYYEEDFNVIIAGEDHSQVAVEIVFPEERDPRPMDSTTTNTADDGRTYRVEWIVGESFPLGQYTVNVTIDEQAFSVIWDRQDVLYSTIWIGCQILDDED
ncbi:MAG: hypothetical protein OXG39_17800 [Chloroflexi bacterium]|nr:hypothetical protein [Chloroflexota bacterium]